MTPGIKVVLPIRTESPNRVRGLTRGARMGIAAKVKAQKSVAALAVGAHLRARSLTGPALAPVVVKLTRVSAGTLDTDNLASALKATRDGVARALGIDDGDVGRLRFVYAQRRGKRREYAVEVLIEHEARPLARRIDSSEPADHRLSWAIDRMEQRAEEEGRQR